MFDNVQFETSYSTSYYKIDDIELPTNTGREYEGGNLGHRPRAKGGYFPVAPVDSAVDIRGEMVSTMIEMGLPCDKHHHEVAAAQHELGLTFGTLTQTADRMQIYKYVVHQVAHAYGKSATFMPKPIKEDNGSGMHTHLSIWQGKEPLFAGNGYAGLSDMPVAKPATQDRPDGPRAGLWSRTRRTRRPSELFDGATPCAPRRSPGHSCRATPTRS